MIKGVNKRIVEIKCTNNEYFDRALLFVNSKSELFSESDPKIKAGEYLDDLNEEFESASLYDDNSRERSKKIVIAILLGVIVVSVLTVALIAL